jgi:hypothetical protein
VLCPAAANLKFVGLGKARCELPGATLAKARSAKALAPPPPVVTDTGTHKQGGAKPVQVLRARCQVHETGRRVAHHTLLQFESLEQVGVLCV